jgi:hypothetical protein
MKAFISREQMNGKTLMIAGFAVIAFILIIYFAGKKKGKEDNREIVIPDDLGEVDESAANQIASELLNDIDFKTGFFFRKFSLKPFLDCNGLSDANFLRCIQIYNEKYENRDFLSAMRKVSNLPVFVGVINTIIHNARIAVKRAENMGITSND